MGRSYLYGYYTSQILPALQFGVMVAGSGLLARHIFLGIRGIEDSILPRAPAMAVALVLIQDLFVLLVGGNWMPFYRFLAPTIPLKNALLAWLACSLLARAQPHLVESFARRAVSGALVAIALGASLAQLRTRDVNHLNPEIGNYSSTLPRDFFKGTLAEINRRAVELTLFHREDLQDTLPFIRGPLSDLVRKYKRVTVLSGHAGYFPYLLRQYFRPEQVWFIDIFGLADQEVAQLKVPKNHWGNLFGNSLFAIYDDQAPRARAHLADPQVCYIRFGDPAVYKFFSVLGFRPIWERPHAYVFFREGLPSRGLDPHAGSKRQRPG